MDGTDGTAALTLLPVLASIATVVTAALFLGIGVGAGAFHSESRVGLYVLGALLYVVTSFVSYFFSAAPSVTASPQPLSAPAKFWCGH